MMNHIFYTPIEADNQPSTMTKTLWRETSCRGMHTIETYLLRKAVLLRAQRKQRASSYFPPSDVSLWRQPAKHAPRLSERYSSSRHVLAKSDNATTSKAQLLQRDDTSMNIKQRVHLDIHQNQDSRHNMVTKHDGILVEHS